MRLLPVLCALALIASAQTARALSCLRPDVVRSYERAVDSPILNRVILGKITLLDKAPKADGSKAVTAQARITGYEITTKGFTAPYEAKITVQTTCAGPWCGHLPGTSQGLVFLSEAEGTPVLSMGPCGGGYFPDPSKEDLSRVLTCHRGGKCEARQGR